jgi:hypothetical protein
MLGDKVGLKKFSIGLGILAHASSPSYSGGRDRRIAFQSNLDIKCETLSQRTIWAWVVLVCNPRY